MKKQNNRPAMTHYHWAAVAMADAPQMEGRIRAILSGSGGRTPASSGRSVTAVLAGTGTLLFLMGAVHSGKVRQGSRPLGGVAFAANAVASETAPTTAAKAFIGTVSPDTNATRRITDGDVSVEVVGLSARNDRTPVPASLQKSKTESQMPKYEFQRTIQNSWKPDGSPFVHPLYPQGMWYFDGRSDKNLIEVALRVQSKSGVPVKVVGDSVGCVAGPNAATSVELQSFHLPDDIWLEQVDFSRRQKTFPLRLGVAGGAYRWHADQKMPVNSISDIATPTVTMAGTPTKVTFSQPLRDASGRTTFVVTNTDLVLPHSILPSCNTRIVAIDRQGREFEPTEQQAFTGHGYMQTTVFFNPKVLPLAQIATLRFEARPYRWITFDNIALYPKKAFR